MKLNRPTLFLSCLIISILLSSTSVQAGKKIIKWVDSNGKTHYGDRPPMPKSTQKQVKSNKSDIKVEPPGAGASQQSEAQQRYDHALINSYGSVDEIELARIRNIEIDTLTLESLQLRQKKLQASAKANQQSNSAELSALQNIELQIELREKTIAATNARYLKDKLRYRELTSLKDSK